MRAGVYHPIVCRETTALDYGLYPTRIVYHPIVCRETTAKEIEDVELQESISPYCL